MDKNVLDRPEDYENEILNEIDGRVDKKSEMTRVERAFVNGIVRQFKPKKILEVGIAAGSTTTVILNAIKDIDNSLLYSIDYNTIYYRSINKLSGYLVDDVFSDNNIKNKWRLFTGGVSAKFMDSIYGDIDLCILDTVHYNPGEILDILMILPYLKKNAVVVIHDIEFHTINYNYGHTCGILFSVLKGKKILPRNSDLKFGYPNIGAVVLDKDINEDIDSIFKLLTLKWNYLPSKDDNKYILQAFTKNYTQYYSNLYNKIYTEHSHNLNKKVIIFNQIINHVARLIPTRGLRDNLRKKFTKS